MFSGVAIAVGNHIQLDLFCNNEDILQCFQFLKKYTPKCIFTFIFMQAALTS